MPVNTRDGMGTPNACVLNFRDDDLKGLSHEIDFKNFDKKLLNLA
jgi:hypothetical protein